MRKIATELLSSLSRQDLVQRSLFLHDSLSQLLAGENVECPLCGGRFENFLPFGVKSSAFRNFHVIGGGYRQNARCPECLSLERERLTYLYLKRESRVFAGDLSVLHVAPERCLAMLLRNACGKSYISADLYDPAVMERLDVTRMGFHDSSFDLVLCNHVLEHVPDDIRAMKELFRVLKPGGEAILLVPISWDLAQTYESTEFKSEEARLVHFGQRNHVRIYGRDYLFRLESVGFVTKLYDPATALGETESRLYGLLQEEKLILGNKLY